MAGYRNPQARARAAWAAMHAAPTPNPTPTTTPGGQTYLAAEGATSLMYGTGFIDAHAVYDAAANKTYYGFEGNRGETRLGKVLVYDHAADAYIGPNVAFVGGITDDDHGGPAITLPTSDGYKLVEGGAHNSTTQKVSSEAMPGSNFYWTALTLSDFSGSYPHPSIKSDVLFSFFRDDGTPGNRPIVLRKTTALTAGAPTMGAKRSLVDMGSDSRSYMTQFEDVGNNRIFSWTRANEADDERKHIYMAKFSYTDESLTNLAGTTTVASASQPIDLTTGMPFRLYTHGAGRTGNGAAFCIDASGNYHVVFMDGAVPTTTNQGAFDLLYVSVSADGATVSAPLKIADMTGRRDPLTIVVNGTNLEVYFTQNPGGTFDVGGTIMRITRPVAGGSWTTPTVIMAPERGYALGSINRIRGTNRIVFGERAADATVEAGDLRLYEWNTPANALRTRPVPTVWTPRHMGGTKLRREFDPRAMKAGKALQCPYTGSALSGLIGTPARTDNALNGLPVITFNGSSAFEAASVANLPVGAVGGELWFVGGPASAGGQFLMAYGTETTGAAKRALVVSGAAGNFIVLNDGTNSVASAVSGLSGAFIARARFEGTTGTIQVNGGAAVTGTIASLATASDRTRIGANCNAAGANYFNGQFGRGLVTELLTDTEAEKMFGFLAARFGLQSVLPAGHPYKSSAPTL